MAKTEILKRIEEIGIIPVVRTSSGEGALAVAEVMRDAGLPILEITMTVPGAVGVIAQLTKQYGNELLVGAGTVMDPQSAQDCIAAGAQFVVSPSLNFQTIELCKQKEIAVFPGALTPTEVASAWQAGADAVKIFPCSSLGGPTYLRALKAPFPSIRMIPTGGVSLSTAKEFIAAGAWALGVGSDLIPNRPIQPDERESLAAAARNYVASVREMR
jgi:2-dehydro-3-deoxyphosphogluconate aldolase/(4S)-4-hydroxy-2-oxoglutarate aldolase